MLQVDRTRTASVYTVKDQVDMIFNVLYRIENDPYREEMDAWDGIDIIRRQ